MLEILQTILLGIVQGLTEFLPVSSSGHLFLGQYFMGLDQDRFGLAFDVAMHLGTLLAVVAFFWRDLLSIARAFLRSGRDGPCAGKTRLPRGHTDANPSAYPVSRIRI